VSWQALNERADLRPEPPRELPDPDRPQQAEYAEDADHDGPGALLWATLCLAPDEGISVPNLVNETGMSRRWVYYRLRALADAAHAIQTEHGTWRAADPESDAQ
jgi:S-DNA-T family DNA segregation ATPase FtsK/SpoIIIE